MIKLSIITINLNNKDGLRKTIESIIYQTWQDFEYIVIDGGSTDGSVQVIKEYSQNISYWVSESDKGIYNAMNKGIDIAKGEYLLFLNSGDTLHQKTTVEAVIASGLQDDLIMGLVEYIPSKKIGYKDVRLPITLLNFYKGAPVPHPATFIKRHLLNNFRYDENLKIVSDWKFFLQAIIIAGCSCKKLNFVISDFSEGGISGNRDLAELERQSVFEELLPYRIRLDYIQFLNGSGYNETDYDRFFIKLKDYRYSKAVYALSVLLVRFISLFRSSAKFARKFPLSK